MVQLNYNFTVPRVNSHGSTQGNAWFPLTGIRVPRLLTLLESRSLVEPRNEPRNGSMYYREATFS